MKSLLMLAGLCTLLIASPAIAGLDDGPVTDTAIVESGILDTPGDWYDDGILPGSIIMNPIQIAPLVGIDLSAKSRELHHWSGDIALADRIGPDALQILLYAPGLKQQLIEAVGKTNYDLIWNYLRTLRERGFSHNLVICTVSSDSPFWSHYTSERRYDEGVLKAGDTAICFEIPLQIQRYRSVHPNGFTDGIDTRIMLAIGQDVCANPAFGIVKVKWYFNGIPPQYIRVPVSVPTAPTVVTEAPSVTIINQSVACMPPLATYNASGMSQPYSNTTTVYPWWPSQHITVNATASATASATGGGTGTTTTCPPGSVTLPSSPSSPTDTSTNAGGIGAGSGTGDGPGTGSQPGDSAGGTRSTGSRTLPSAN